MTAVADDERTRQLLLDYGERILLLILYAPFFLAFSRQLDQDPWSVALLITEAVVLVLVIFRRHGATIPALLAFAATFTPLLTRPTGPAVIWIGGPIMAAAAVWCLLAKATMNRRWGILAANRGVQTKGPYMVLRHPVYAGYLVANIGLLLSWPSWRNVALVAISLALQIARLLEEEKFLSLDPAYRTYMERVRYRLIPFVF